MSIAENSILCVTKVSKVNREDKYFLDIDLTGHTNPIRIPTTFEAVEPLILQLHALGILGNRRYCNGTDSHITEFPCPAKDTYLVFYREGEVRETSDLLNIKYPSDVVKTVRLSDMTHYTGFEWIPIPKV